MPNSPGDIPMPKDLPISVLVVAIVGGVVGVIIAVSIVLLLKQRYISYSTIIKLYSVSQKWLAQVSQ